MGRRRSVDRDALLDAAETVVRRDGAARLTLEAVAAEAGISKASVLYDVGSKSGLIAAIVERKMAEGTARMRALENARGGGPDACVLARIAFAEEELSQADREVTMSICGALAADAALAAPIRAEYDRLIDEIRARSPRPRGAMLAFLAVEGMQTLERFDLHEFAPGERRALLSDIERLAGQDPGGWTDHDDAPARTGTGPQDAPRPAPAGHGPRRATAGDGQGDA
ncbi:MAG: TetR/AcrR family transcriptional regulator [Pseudomonadota bacterium]|nr:TetR/AcrR family transcriptional regulator [Pseudomonadota bacterium]